MSTTNAPAYCEEADVQEALQETSANMQGPLDTANVEAAVFAASRWLRGMANAHWYDSNAAASDLVSSTAFTTTDRTLDVPSSPHPQNGQLLRTTDTTRDVRYPRTMAGPYVRVRLPVNHVDSLDALRVRDYGGETTDWVADSSFASGRGEDYYLRVEGGVLGKSYVYLHAGSLGAHVDFEELLEVDVSYGQDWDSEPWDDVRRGVAAIAAAQLVSDDDVLTQVPDNGNLIGLDTQVQQLLNQAFADPGYLTQYVPTHPVA